MRIAVFTPLLAAGNELESGIGVHYRDLAIGLKQSGEDVEVFHFPYETNQSKSWYFEGIPIHSIGLKNPKIPNIKGLGSLCKTMRFFDLFETAQLFQKSRRVFAKAHESNSFDIIEASSNRGICFGASTLIKRPPIFTRVSTTMRQIFRSENSIPDLNFRLAARFEEKQILRSEHLVTHTKRHANEVSKLLRFTNGKFKIIPHGISTISYFQTQETESCSKDIVKVLYVGRLEHRKGFDVLIQAIQPIVRMFPNIHFDICGSGEMFEKAKSELSKKFPSKIIFHGYQDRHKLDSFYSNCDIFVAPSRYESFGLIYLEAMKFSKPVVACNSGGTPEVVQNGVSGILVKPGNADLLSKAVLLLAKDPALRKKMGETGRARLEKIFSMKTLIETTKSHYLEALAKKN